MSEEMLEGFDDALAVAKKFSDDEYLKKVLFDNENNAAEWMKELREGEEDDE